MVAGKWALRRVLWAPLRWRATLARGPVRPDRLGIAAIVKNEAPYLLEWIAWHRCLGITDFFIADNISTDGTSDLLQDLHDRGIVTRVVWPRGPGGASPQLPAYRHLAKTHGGDVDWLAFFDADEFLRPASLDGDPGGVVQLWLARRPARVAAVAVNWANYGSSFRHEPGTGLVIERFTRRGPQSMPENRYVKAIVRPRFWRGTRSGPHAFAIARWSFYIDTTGALQPRSVSGQATSEAPVWGDFRLDHYRVKSRLEFDQRKAARGRVSKATTASPTYHDADFRLWDRNEVEDPVPPAFVQRVRDEIARLQGALADGAPVRDPQRHAG